MGIILFYLNKKPLVPVITNSNCRLFCHIPEFIKEEIKFYKNTVSSQFIKKFKNISKF